MEKRKAGLGRVKGETAGAEDGREGRTKSGRNKRMKGKKNRRKGK